MSDLLAVVVPLLLVDVLNPVLLAAMVYSVGTSRPQSTSWALLGGHTLAYFCAGIVIALGLERITSFLGNPGTPAFVLEIVLGVALVWAGVAARGGGASEPKRTLSEPTPAAAFGYGVIINFIGVPFALPYFAVLDQFLKADLSPQVTLVLLLGYNLMYALPFVLVPLAAMLLGERSRPLLQRVNDWVNRAADLIMPIILVAAGAALVADGAWYFTSGVGLF